LGELDDVASMGDRRRRPRFEIDQPVTLKGLDDPSEPLPASLVNFSTKGIRLILGQKLNPGNLVKVEWGGTILLGEIIYCLPLGSEFAAGIEIEDAVYETEVLAPMQEVSALAIAQKH
jgi:hypothetical protein